MSSARIDLHSGGGFCSLPTMDRAKPAVMEPYMTNSQWTTFCDEIEESLKPVNKATKIAFMSFGLTFITFIVVMIISFVSFSSGFSGGFDDDFFTGGGGGGSNGGNNGGSSAFILFAVPAGTMLLGMATICYASSKAHKATIEIQRICKETSERQPRLSFHVRYEYSFYPSYGSSSHFHHGQHHHHGHTHMRQYIEVSILQNTTTTSVPTNFPASVAESSLYASSYNPAYTSANAIAPAEGAGTTVQNRLQTLEDTKHLLTQKEYDQKRDEILNNI